MVINGLWHQCDDGVVRPVVQAEVVANNGSWVKAPFLLDTGADRTVFSADVLAALGLPLVEAAEHLGGIGSFCGDRRLAATGRLSPWSTSRIHNHSAIILEEWRFTCQL